MHEKQPPVRCSEVPVFRCAAGMEMLRAIKEEEDVIGAETEQRRVCRCSMRLLGTDSNRRTERLSAHSSRPFSAVYIRRHHFVVSFARRRQTAATGSPGGPRIPTQLNTAGTAARGAHHWLHRGFTRCWSGALCSQREMNS